MSRFIRSIEIMAPVEKVYEFHAHPANLVRIAPPNSRTELMTCTDTVLRLGSRVTVRTTQAGIPVRIEAEVLELEPPRLLKDSQIHGPFAHWVHTHHFDPIPGGVRLTDQVDYALPMGIIGGVAAGHLVARELRSMFEFRQAETKRILESEAAGT